MRLFLIFFFVLFLKIPVFAKTETGFHISNEELTPITKTKESSSGLIEFFTNSNGISEYIETPFGYFRLISAYQGITNDNIILLAFETQMKKGWALKKPTIPSENNPDIIEEKILYPLNDLSENKTVDYTNETLFPIIYHIKENTQTLSIKKTISLTACNNETCLSQPISLELNLNKGNTYPTFAYAFILDHLKQIPIKPTSDILSTKLIRIDPKHIQLIATFNSNIDFVNLQINTDDAYKIIKKDFENNKAFILIENSTLQKNDKLSLILISQLGIMEQNPSLEINSYTIPKNSFNYFSCFFNGIWLFLLSPLLLLFLSLSDNKEELKQQTSKIIRATFIIAILSALLIYIYPASKSIFEIKGIDLILSTGILIYLLKKPNITLLSGLVFFFVFPKPYLISTLDTLSTKLFGILLVFILWAFLCSIPFMCFKNTSRLFKEIKKVKQYKIIIRLPQIILLLWIIITFIGQFAFQKNKIKDFEKYRNENKTIFVSIENSPCLHCLINKSILYHISKINNNLSDKDIKIITLKTNTKSGQDFLKKQKLDTKTNGLLYGNELPYPLIIDKYQPYENWQKYFNKVSTTINITDSYFEK